VVDYVVAAKRQSVHRVIQGIREAYPTQTDTIAGTPWCETVDKLVHLFEQQQALRQFLLSRKGMPKTLSSEMAAAGSWLDNNGVSIHRMQSTMFLLTSNECRLLSHRIATLTGRAVEEWPHACGAMVIPFLSDFLSISHLSLSPLHPNPVSSKSVVWNVTPTRTSFSGLWECRTGVLNNARFVNAPIRAAALTERQADLQSGDLYVGVATTAGVPFETSLRFARDHGSRSR